MIQIKSFWLQTSGYTDGTILEYAIFFTWENKGKSVQTLGMEKSQWELQVTLYAQS